MPTPAFVCTPPQRCAGELLLRGFGAPVEKSAELLSVSVQPPSARWTAFVFEGAGAAEVSEQVVPDPKPTKSTTVAPNGQPLPESGVVALTRATLPALALMLMALHAWGWRGRSTPPFQIRGHDLTSLYVRPCSHAVARARATRP